MQKKRKITLVAMLIMLAGVIFLWALYYYKTFFRSTLTESFYIVLEKFFSYLPRIAGILAIIIGTKFLIKIIDTLLKKYLKYFTDEKEYFSFFLIIKYSLWFIAIIACVSLLFGNIGAWLTSLGLIGFGVTFALQKPILNFVAWLTIVFVKTYSIGDRINIGNIRGDVINITMMYTVLDGLLENTDELSGKIVTVPNEMVLTSSVMNYTKSGFFLWDELSVSITYESNWSKGLRILKEITSKVVTKFIEEKRPEIIRKHRNFVDIFHNLKMNHIDETDEERKMHLHQKMKDVHDEKEKYAADREKINQEILNKPLVRVGLLDSSIELNVRYLSYYKTLRVIRSEIYRAFLDRVSEEDDLEMAYPHMQIVYNPKKGIQKKNIPHKKTHKKTRKSKPKKVIKSKSYLPKKKKVVLTATRH